MSVFKLTTSLVESVLNESFYKDQDIQINEMSKCLVFNGYSIEWANENKKDAFLLIYNAINIFIFESNKIAKNCKLAK